MHLLARRLMCELVCSETSVVQRLAATLSTTSSRVTRQIRALAASFASSVTVTSPASGEFARLSCARRISSWCAHSRGEQGQSATRMEPRAPRTRASGGLHVHAPCESAHAQARPPAKMTLIHRSRPSANPAPHRVSPWVCGPTTGSGMTIKFCPGVLPGC